MYWYVCRRVDMSLSPQLNFEGEVKIEWVNFVER